MLRVVLPKFTFSSLVNLKINEENKAAYITLVNPKKRNTLSFATLTEINDALGKVEQSVSEKKTKILVLGGEGPVFSSGHDLKELKNSGDPKEVFDLCTKVMLRIRKFQTPTLAAINGIAAAAGFQLAMACDLVLATEKSSFGCPGIKWGLFCSTPGVELIRSCNSQKKAMEMLLFGELISAQEAYQYGIINKVVSEEAFSSQIEGYVQKAFNLSGEVTALGKKILRQQKNAQIEQAYCIAGDGMNNNIKNMSDCQEGLAAFVEKRHPHYKN